VTDQVPMREDATDQHQQPYARRTITLDPESDAVLEALHEESGKPYSEVVRLGLMSLRGNRRLIRHALSQPMNALRLKLNILAAICGKDDPGTLEIVEEMHEQFRRIDSILAPPLRVTSDPDVARRAGS
jgi:hypothetical protein